MRRLWDRAAKQSLTAEEVQHGLNRLADWVSVTEKSAPAELV
jgi:hypothetical protein